MDECVAEVVAYAKAYSNLFNLQIMEVADIYDDHSKVNCVNS